MKSNANEIHGKLSLRMTLPKLRTFQLSYLRKHKMHKQSGCKGHFLSRVDFEVSPLVICISLFYQRWVGGRCPSHPDTCCQLNPDIFCQKRRKSTQIQNPTKKKRPRQFRERKILNCWGIFWRKKTTRWTGWRLIWAKADTPTCALQISREECWRRFPRNRKINQNQRCQRKFCWYEQPCKKLWFLQSSQWTEEEARNMMTMDRITMIAPKSLQGLPPFC